LATPIFFIIGRARSGTTLVKALLDAHPNVVVPVECAFLLNLYSKYGKKKYWTDALLKEFIKDLSNEPAYKLMQIDQAGLEQKLASCAGENTYANICMQVYGSCQSFYPKEEIKLLGDKNPAYSLYVEKIREIFPEAKFIHIIRDYRDHIVSMMRVDYEAHIVSSLAYRWKYYNRQIEKTKVAHPDIFYTLKYENFVANTSHYLQEICGFLGIPYEEKMLAYRDKKNDFYENYPKEVFIKYHKSIFDQIDSSKSGTWESKLTEKQIRIAEAVSGDYAERFGYKKTFHDAHFWLNLGVIPGVIYGRLFFTWGAFINILPYKMKMGVIYFFALLFKPYWKRYEKK